MEAFAEAELPNGVINLVTGQGSVVGEAVIHHVLDDLYQQRSSYPRTKQGSFWHKSNYPGQTGRQKGRSVDDEYVFSFCWCIGRCSFKICVRGVV